MKLTDDEAIATQTLVLTSARKRGWGVQCKYVRPDSSRCRAWAIVGGMVCIKHGGQFPQVRRSATARVNALVPVALYRLAQLVDDPDPKVALKAVTFILRRAGINSIEPSRVVSGIKALPPAGRTEADIDELLRRLAFSDLGDGADE